MGMRGNIGGLYPFIARTHISSAHYQQSMSAHVQLTIYTSRTSKVSWWDAIESKGYLVVIVINLVLLSIIIVVYATVVFLEYIERKVIKELSSYTNNTLVLDYVHELINKFKQAIILVLILELLSALSLALVYAYIQLYT